MFLGLDLKLCTDRLRLAFILCNIPIFLIGLSLIGVGIWQVILANRIEEVFSEVNGRIIGGLFIGSGGGLAIISIFGVLGAYFKSRLMLSTVKLNFCRMFSAVIDIAVQYSVILFLAIVSEIAAVGYAFSEASDVEERQVEDNLIHALSRYYPQNDTAYDDDINDVIDFIQDDLECCGVTSINDWSAFSPYYGELRRLPASCCGREEPDACPESEAFSDTCGEPFFDFVVQNLRNMGIIGISFAAFEVLVLVKACALFIVVYRLFT